MSKYDWNDIVDRLYKMLHLMQAPVGMKWIKTEEELLSIPKVRIHKKKFAPCTVVSQAMQFGWTSACKFENVHVDYCRAINGMYERDEKFYSGKIFDNVWCATAEVSRAHNAALECISAEYVALVASPLAAGRIEPDVCVLYTSSSQAFMLFAGWQYYSYEKLNFTFIGESTCSDSWVRTFNTRKPALALPCFADKKFSGVGEWELKLTFTPEDLVRALEGVKALFKNGLRYPIASYSLTTDIIDGLPESYLEF